MVYVRGGHYRGSVQGDEGRYITVGCCTLTPVCQLDALCECSNWGAPTI